MKRKEINFKPLGVIMFLLAALCGIGGLICGNGASGLLLGVIFSATGVMLLYTPGRRRRTRRVEPQ